VNVLTLTNLYPSSARPGHGLFVEQRMTRWAARTGGSLRVVAPVPWFPFRRGFGSYSAFARTPLREERKGIELFHPRVLILPKVGMGLAPSAWVNACQPVLAELHRSRPIHILDCHYLYPDAVAGAELARRLRIPFVMSARGSDVNVIGALEGPRRRIVEAASRASAVIAVSGALAEKLRSMGVAEEKLHVISNGVDVDRFAPKPNSSAEKLAEGRVLLGVGRLVRGKGFHVALEAMARLLPEFPDLVLMLAGEGPERPALEAAARAHGISDRLRLLGEVPHDRIPSLLWQAHRFLLPSFNEGYPNVVVEAIAAGCPVVATAVGGIPEIVDSELGDLAVHAEDVGALESALRTSLRRTFDPAAFARKRESLRWDPLIDRLHSVFERAVASAA